MSSTIVTNRLAAVFDNPCNRGDHIWALFEKCYESNVYPQTPRWGAVAIGRIREAMQAIFYNAGGCEGGCLRDRRGAVAPETYIRRWISALRHPVQMPQMYIRLTRKDLRAQFRMPEDPSDDARWEDFCSRMRALGREDIPLSLEDGAEMSLALHQDAELVLAIYGYSRERRGLLAPWRAFGGEWAPVGAPASGIGYFPAGGQIPRSAIPRAYRIDDHALVMLGEDGQWRPAGWAYSAVGDYVKGLWETELRAPGSYQVLIPPYREALEAVRLLPRGSAAVVDLARCPEHSRKDTLALATAFGGQIEKDPQTGLELVRIPWSAGAGHKLAYLPYEATTWHVSEVPSTEVARLCA